MFHTICMLLHNSRSWAVCGACFEVCEVGGHQAAYVTSCFVSKHLLSFVKDIFGAPSVPANCGLAPLAVDYFNHLFYGLSDGSLLFFEVISWVIQS